MLEPLRTVDVVIGLLEPRMLEDADVGGSSAVDGAA